MTRTSDINFHSFFNIVDGKCRSSAKTTCGIDPSTASNLWDVPVATTQDREDAVRAANDAFKSWPSTPVQKRIRLISLFKRLYESHIDSFTELVMAECGKRRALAAGEAHEILTHFDHNLQLQIQEERIEDEERVITTRHVPVGVVTAICPWNFPLILSIGKVSCTLGWLLHHNQTFAERG